MGYTKIEWADAVWNPISGCTKVSDGCRYCYAERMSKRLAGRYGYPADNPFRVTLHPERLEEPLKWQKPQKIFVGSMADWMHDDVPTRFIDKMLDIMAVCSQHTFLTLTKRPQNLEKKIYGVMPEHDNQQQNDVYNDHCRLLGGGDWLPNLWFGVSIEDQKSADERIPALLAFRPAAKRFVSVEPMLGMVDLNNYLYQLDWVICGGETGPKARPMDLVWARSLREQCKHFGVAFFLKQISQGMGPIPLYLMIREWP